MPVAGSSVDMATSGCSLLVDVVVTHGKPGQQRLGIGIRADCE
jgi:hypothetical protein